MLATVSTNVSALEINATINNTNPFKNDLVNLSAKLSDDIGLSFCQFIHNGTNDGSTVILNQSITGTSDECSMVFRIELNGGAINFTIIVNDTDNNILHSFDRLTGSDVVGFGHNESLGSTRRIAAFFNDGTYYTTISGNTASNSLTFEQGFTYTIPTGYSMSNIAGFAHGTGSNSPIVVFFNNGSYFKTIDKTNAFTRNVNFTGANDSTWTYWLDTETVLGFAWDQDNGDIAAFNNQSPSSHGTDENYNFNDKETIVFPSNCCDSYPITMNITNVTGYVYSNFDNINYQFLAFLKNGYYTRGDSGFPAGGRIEGGEIFTNMYSTNLINGLYSKTTVGEIITVGLTDAPIVNVSINNTSPRINDVINISINVSDEVGLFTVNITTNGTIDRKINYTVTGTNIQLSNATIIELGRGNIINITVFVTNTRNIVQIISTLITVTNTVPIITNISITPLPITAGNTLKGHANYSDADNDQTGGNETLWYVNGSIINEANNSFILLGGNVTELSNITFSTRFNDTFEWSDWVNSSQVTVGDATPPTLNNCTLEFGNLNNAAGNTNNFTCTVTDINSLIESIKFNLRTPTANLTRSFSFTQAQSVTTTYVIFESIETLSIGSYGINNVTFKDTSGNEDTNQATGFNFTVSSEPSVPTPPPSRGGAAPTTIIIGKENATFDLLTENLGQEYITVTAFSNSILELPFLIENTGNITVKITLSCIESSNITGSISLCDNTEFEQKELNLAPSSVPFPTFIKIKFPEAAIFDTFSLIIEGVAEDGSRDTLRATFIIFPKASDIILILKQMILGVSKFEGERFTIPIPNIIYFIILETVILLLFLPRQFPFKSTILVGLTILNILIWGSLSFLLCKLEFVTCTALI